MKDSIPSKNLFLVVGIGASAGGLDAFKQFIKALPVDSGMAYILVQHLDPTHESILCDILQKVSLLPVQSVTNNIHVEPDNIYVIPSNQLLTATDGVLKLQPRPQKSHNLPIDLLFKSLAEIHQSKAIGVVLSGTGKDGTQGLKAIKDEGGITFAQDHTAGFTEMPQSAINAGVVDFVLSPDQIVEKLLTLRTAYASDTSTAEVRQENQEDVYFRDILSILEANRGVDFTYYKQTTVRRRILRRMALRNLAKIQDYLEYLKRFPSEADVLFQDILIPVTEFFRDAAIFEHLCETVLPALMGSKRNSESFRIWSVGCSSGQEAYSLAICLFEFFLKQNKGCKLQVFATDLSDVGIAHARSGFYAASELGNVSKQRLEKFFTKTDGGYQLSKAIREMCVFATHNILTNPPFGGIDLISCRNVLIYMEPFLQRKAMATFHYSLNEKGMLLLGKSESLGNSSDLFNTVSESDKFYSRNTIPGRAINISTKQRLDLLENGHKEIKESLPNDDYQKCADEIVLHHEADGVIVNDSFEIVQFRGNTGEWLTSAPGKPNLNVLKMAKQGLSIDLRNTLHKVKASKERVIKEGIVLEISGQKKLVTIEITPIVNTINLYYLIHFSTTSVIAKAETAKSTNGNGKTHPQEIRALRLEKELLQTREDMRTITEDQDAGNEELLSANEELLSGSEELRSLNEELEISKEELQSTVEELSVANQELILRNDELTYSRKYSEAIVATISEPLVVLKKDLKIKSANSAFYKFFHTNEKEVSEQFFYEIDDEQWNIAELRKMLYAALDEDNFYVSYELKQAFKRIGEHVVCINARKVVNEKNSEPLILLVITDITHRKKLEESQQSKADYAKVVLDSNPTITSTASPAGIITYTNKYFLDYSGLTIDQAIELGWNAVVHPEQTADVTKNWMKSVLEEKDFVKEVLLRRYDGDYRWHYAHALPIRNPEGKVTSWVCSCADIHDQKIARTELEKQVRQRTQGLKESNIQLQHSNKNLEQFAYIASHDLQEPLRKIQTFTSMLAENYADDLPGHAKMLVDKINGSSRRLSDLIKDVLHFSKIDHSQTGFVKTTIDEILNNVMTDFALLIDEKKAFIKAEAMPVIEVI
ncbi:MAG TPA: CheR family methyltransferase, partial [Chryseolinea sp.]|nr:CheR family methyltransferase [Chryseolinea sp.]